MRYHTNPAGNSGPCYAKNGQCPFDSEHFDTLQEARDHYEKEQIENIFPETSKKSWKSKFTKIGAGVLATIALTNVGSITAHAAPQQTSWLDDILGDSDSISQEYNKALDEIGEILKDYQYSGDYRSGGGSFSDFFKDDLTSKDSDVYKTSDGVYFQGKSLDVPQEEIDKALEKLNSLDVRPENKHYEYNRAEHYGRSFQTGVVGKTERRDVTNGIFKNDSPQARAIGGTFIDPYTGKEVEIIKGSRDDTNVDHIVPLHEVAKSENKADPLTAKERLAIANDFENLQVVSAKSNREKSDKDPAKWMPSYTPAWESYAISYINVKAKYNLSVDQNEYNALNSYLN